MGSSKIEVFVDRTPNLEEEQFGSEKLDQIGPEIKWVINETLENSLVCRLICLISL